MSLEPVDLPTAPARRKKLIWPFVVIGVVALSLSGVVLVVLVVAYQEVSKPLAVTVEDRETLVTADDLVPRVEGFEPQPGVEKLTKTRGLDGAIELEYTYDLSDQGMSLSSSVTTDRTASGAATSYTGLRVGLDVGFKLSADAKTKVEERNDLFAWGDESRSMVVVYDGKPVGNLFVARKGRHVFAFTVVGVYFGSEEVMGDLLLPKLERLGASAPAP